MCRFSSQILTKMTKREFIEAVASGLRKMNYTPYYLLIIAERFNDWEQDLEMLEQVQFLI
jgi:hypothetical protein